MYKDHQQFLALTVKHYQTTNSALRQTFHTRHQPQTVIPQCKHNIYRFPVIFPPVLQQLHTKYFLEFLSVFAWLTFWNQKFQLPLKLHYRYFSRRKKNSEFIVLFTYATVLFCVSERVFRRFRSFMKQRHTLLASFQKMVLTAMQHTNQQWYY